MGDDVSKWREEAFVWMNWDVKCNDHLVGNLLLMYKIEILLTNGNME
jgi:hypothetical protein